MAGSSSYALGSAFGYARPSSGATGGLLGTQVRIRVCTRTRVGKPRSRGEPRDQPILPFGCFPFFFFFFLFFPQSFLFVSFTRILAFLCATTRMRRPCPYSFLPFAGEYSTENVSELSFFIRDIGCFLHSGISVHRYVRVLRSLSR